jgi:hypothetical protein
MGKKILIKIIILGVLFLIAVSAGIYFEEFTDIVFSVTFNGILQTKPGSIFNNYECLFLFSPAIQWLQHKWMAVNMYGIVIYSLNTFIIYRLIFFLLYYDLSKKSDQFLRILSTGFIMLLLHDYIFIQFTKTAVYYCFFGLFLLWNFPRQYIKAFLFILIGLLLRAETFWFIFLFLFIYCVVLEKDIIKKKIYPHKLTWLVLLIICVIISAFNKNNFTEDDKRYETFRAYKYSMLDFKQTTSLKEIHYRDSMKLIALDNAFFGDRDSLLNTTIFKRLHVSKHERFAFNVDFYNFTDIYVLIQKINSIYYLLISFKSYYFLCFSLLFFILFYPKINNNLRKKIILIYIIGIVYIFFITLYIKMETRVLNPFIMVLIFSGIFLLRNNVTNPTINKKIKIANLVLLICVLFYFKDTVNQVRHKKEFIKQSESFLYKWNAQNQKSVLIPDLFSWEIWFPKVFVNTNSIHVSRLMSLDDGYMSMMSGHLEYMKDIVHSNHFKDYVDYLIQHKEKVYFVGTEERIRLLERYISIIYDIHLNIRKADEIPVVKGKGVRGDIEYYLYRMN